MTKLNDDNNLMTKA